MTLDTLRQVTRNRYGLALGATADDLYTDAMLTSIINQAIRLICQKTFCLYQAAKSISLVNGTQTYALGTDVLLEDESTFVYTLASTYTRLKPRRQESLLEQYGPFQSVAAAATLGGFFCHAGYQDNNQRMVTIIPAPNASGTLKFNAWIYPTDLSANSDTPELADGDQDIIHTVACWKLAEFDLSRGREGAQGIEVWAKEAMEGIDSLRARLMSTMTRPLPRSLREPRELRR